MKNRKGVSIVHSLLIILIVIFLIVLYIVIRDTSTESRFFDDVDIKLSQKVSNLNEICIISDRELVRGNILGSSMNPELLEGIVILVTEFEVSELSVGDIIWYNESSIYNAPLIHTIDEIGLDSKGWYAKTKGSNNYIADFFKVREEQIIGIVIGNIKK